MLDAMQRTEADVLIGWGGWESVAWMLARTMWEELASLFRGSRERHAKLSTTFIDAALVGGTKNKLVNPAVVCDI